MKQQKYVITINFSEDTEDDMSDTIAELIQDINCVTYQVDRAE